MYFLDRISPRVLIGIVVLTGIACFFPVLGQKTHWSSREARHGQIAKEMVLTGNYKVPHYSRELYVDKPPLYHWLAAGCIRLLDRTDEVPVRMPSAIFAILGALGVFAMGNRLYGRKEGFIAAIVLIGTAYFFKWAVMARMDMVMTGALIWVGAFTVYSGMTRSVLRRWLFAAAAGLCLAAATMTKGLPPFATGLLIITLVLFCLPTRKKNIGSFLLLAVAIVAFVILIWFGIIYDTGFIQGFLNFQTGGTGPKHQEAIYYYLLNLPQMLLPWSFWVPFAVWASWKNLRRTRDATAALPMVVSVGILIFFSLFGNKRPHYLLPMLPFVSLLLARYFLDVLRRIENGDFNADRLIRWPALAMLTLMPVLALVVIFSQKGTPVWAVFGVAAILLLVVILSVAAFSGRVRRSAPASLIFLTLAAYLVWGGVLPAAAYLYWQPESEIRIAKAVCERMGPNVPIGVGRQLRDQVAFCLPDRIPVPLDNDRQAIVFASGKGEKYLLIDKDTAARILQQMPRRATVIGNWRYKPDRREIEMLRIGNAVVSSEGRTGE